MKPGIYSGIPNNVYHSGDEISSSKLKPLREGKDKNTLQHWIHELSQPPKYKQEWSLGTLVHGLVLEPDRSQEIFRIAPANGFGAKDKGLWKEWLQQESGQNIPWPMTKDEVLAWIAKNLPWTVVTPDQYERGFAMTEAILANPDAREAVTGGEAELSVYDVDPTTKLPVKVRPDYWAGELQTDVKTCACASPRAIERDAENYGWGLQGAMYMDVGSRHRDVSHFMFVCVESDPPHIVQCYRASESFVESGWEDYRYTMHILAEAKKSGVYGGYSDGMLEVNAPRWKQTI